MGVNTDNKIWYLARNGKRHGPISDLEMSKLVEMGHLKEKDLVWRPGFEEWQSPLSVFTPSKTTTKAPKDSDQKKVYKSDILKTPLETSIKEKVPPKKTERPPQQQLKKTTQVTEDSFQWDVYYEGEGEGEDEHQSQDDEDYTVESKNVSGKKSIKKFALASIFIMLVGGIATVGYYYFNEVELATNVLISQLVSKRENSTISSSRARATLTETAELESQKGTAENTDFEKREKSIDITLQKSSMWALLKKEFPEWYNIQLADIRKMQDENKTEFEINKKLTESLVALRRQNAQKALAASSDQLQKIASTFITNLASLEETNVKDCYGYISNGELEPFAISMLQNPTEGANLHAQIEAVFEAVIIGKKAPSTYEGPQKSDYDLLATELGNLGWSEADIQLFADPKILSNSPPAKVCKMVREWFSAHLSIKDELARDKLLFETLRPLIAG